ncbi:uncharacterized protein VP01_2087g9 [Puccinia sorghi]|uniref:U1-C C2H2-type zinc finger domain-containing protein n=1 Tax=Puccinia sorghi TaxID=27349 RepID=A0A0L6VC70_9BASI|nr:uncharacterized protein VP01_2087g9 [Puccinia sorghi]
MTEYWVSKQSYFCKYCDIFIRVRPLNKHDDKPSRDQHEKGLRHKGNLERYIREIYKKEDRAKRERADEASQLSKIEKAARAAHEQQDLGGVSEEKEEKQEEEKEPRKRTKFDKTQEWKGASNLENYSDARSLGFVADEELEAATRASEEKERRSREGLMGKWEAVAKVQPASTNKASSSSGSSIPTINREKITAQLLYERDPDKKPIRKLFSERSVDLDSPDSLDHAFPIKLKVDRRSQSLKREEHDLSSAALHGSIQPIRLDGFHSSKNPSEENIKAENPPSNDPVKLEEEDIKPTLDEMVSPKVETPVLFKKRKATHAQLRQRT